MLQLTTFIQIDMSKFQALSGLAESTAKHKINKLLRKAKGADTATPETGKKSRGRKRKAGVYTFVCLRKLLFL